MIIACVCFSCLACSLALVLLARLQKAGSAVSRSRTSHFEMALGRFLANSIDTNILEQAGSRGLGDIDVRFEEAHDRFRDVGQLVQVILETAQDNKMQNLVQLTKHLYQLQHSLAVPISSIHECLTIVIGRLMSCQPGTQVKLVQEGELVDMKLMFPLNAGSRVRQPLGVVVYDPEGKVVSKAKVLCG